MWIISSTNYEIKSLQEDSESGDSLSSNAFIEDQKRETPFCGILHSFLVNAQDVRNSKEDPRHVMLSGLMGTYRHHFVEYYFIVFLLMLKMVKAIHIAFSKVYNVLQSIQYQAVHFPVQFVLLVVVLHWEDAVHGNTELDTTVLHLKHTHTQSVQSTVYWSSHLKVILPFLSLLNID